MSRVLVIGRTGMLGSAMTVRLRETGFTVIALDRRDHDILRDPPEALPLDDVDHVVNCSGLINRHLGSAAEADFLMVNAVFPRRLADACAARGRLLVHISTDCVFDGSGAPHDEASPPAPKDLYGRSKLYGEPANAMVLRSSLIGPECRHFHSLLCWFLATEGRCQGYVNHLWNGVTTVAMADMVAHLIRRGACRPGLFHLPGETITKHDLLHRMADAFSHRVEIEPVTAATPRDMRLATRHPALLDGFTLPPIAAQLGALAARCDRSGHWAEPAGR